MTLPRRSAVSSLALCLLLLAGCRSSGTEQLVEALAPPPKVIALTLQGTPGMNMENAALVRVYTLRSTSPPTQVSLEELWAQEASALGSDLVQREEYRLFPGDEQAVRLEVSADVRSVVVAANLQQAEDDAWFQFFEVSDLLGDGRIVIIEAQRITVVE